MIGVIIVVLCGIVVVDALLEYLRDSQRDVDLEAEQRRRRLLHELERHDR